MAIAPHGVIMVYLNYAWRLVATALGFTLFGIFGLLTPVIASPWIRWRYSSPEARQRCARWLIHRSFLCFIHILRFLGVITWDVKGQERLRRPGLLVLANHPCLVDVAFLMAFIPNPDCIVKERLFANPFMRGYLRLTGFIANGNAVGLIEDARASLASGSSLIIFPEGTRTDPNGPLYFQRGAANVALRTRTMITPVAIVCEPLTLTKKHRWYHIPPAKPHIILSVGEDISLAAYERLPMAVAARTLTRHLQDYFTEELHTHEHNRHGQPDPGIETADYRHTGP